MFLLIGVPWVRVVARLRDQLLAIARSPAPRFNAPHFHGNRPRKCGSALPVTLKGSLRQRLGGREHATTNQGSARLSCTRTAGKFKAERGAGAVARRSFLPSLLASERKIALPL